jgi:hypothetical protein
MPVSDIVSGKAGARILGRRRAQICATLTALA